MIRRAHLGYALIVAGVSIGLLSLGFGGGTQRACPGIDSVVYETIGVQPTGAAITGIDLRDATIAWYDGCNWRTHSLIPLVIGGLVSVAGVVTARSTEPGESHIE